MENKIKEKKFKDKKSYAKEAKRAKGRKHYDDEDRKKAPYLGHNDINWRTADATMAELVGNLPFGQPAGLHQKLNVGEFAAAPSVVPVTIPGIMTIRTRITAGQSSDYNSAINLSTRKIYSFVRHANSGSRNTEAADMGVYFLALGQALALLGWIQRIYRLVNMFSSTNRFTPAKLLNAMAVDYDDIVSNQPRLKYLIAWFGRAIGALAFPDLPYFHACYEAYKWVIRDSDSPKEQFYLLDSAGFGKYDPTYDSAGGGVTYTLTNGVGVPTTISSYLTYAKIEAMVHEVMDVLLSDEDCGIISGDILKAFPNGSGLFVPQAFGDYDVFIKDDELLQQIHNCHPLDENVFPLRGYKQNAGGTNQAPFIEIDVGTPGSGGQLNSPYMLGHYLFIDAFSKVPDAKEVVNCTVLNPQYKLLKDSGTNKYTITEASFDLHLPVYIYATASTAPGTGAVDVTSRFARWYLQMYIMSGNVKILNFDWHPIMISATGSSGSYTELELGSDIQNARFFSYDVGQRIHDNSMLSLFGFQDNNFITK